jgi:hypothetical protein
VHASLEEELFYPAVRAQLGTVTIEEEPTDKADGDADTDEADADMDTDLIAQAQEEHQAVKGRGARPCRNVHEVHHHW